MYLPRKVQKIGNSYHICLPAEIIKQLGIVEDDKLLVNIVYGDIVIRSEKFGSLKERRMTKLREENAFGSQQYQ